MNSPTSDRFSNAAAVDADARAFDAFAETPDAVDLEAATWAVRQRNGLDDRGEAELRAWMDADPRHAAALGGMTATLGNVRQLSGDDVAALKAGLSQRHRQAFGASATPLPKPERRARRVGFGLGPIFAPAAVAILMVTAVGAGWTGWDYWRGLPTFEQAFVTERGQQLAVTLPDDPAHGSTVQLDTATRLESRLFRTRREVRLQDGQALFAVHADKDRPFHVWAGDLHITVVGTRFSVRHTTSGLDAGRTVVSVEEGHVRVARANANANADASDGSDAPVELVAGQMVVGDDSGHIGPVTRVSPTAVAPWRSGRISFDNTPLAQALAEFERYRSTGLVIKDPAVASLPVGGSYSLQQFSRFVEALPLVLPVRLMPQGDVTEIALRKP